MIGEGAEDYRAQTRGNVGSRLEEQDACLEGSGIDSAGARRRERESRAHTAVSFGGRTRGFVSNLCGRQGCAASGANNSSQNPCKGRIFPAFLTRYAVVPGFNCTPADPALLRISQAEETVSYRSERAWQHAWSSGSEGDSAAD